MSESSNADIVLSGLPADTPIYTVVGVCRSGTTAVEKLLTLSGVQAYHQPIKSSFVRGITQIDLAPYEQVGPEVHPVAIKETLGAYSPATCTFDPLEVMLNSVSDADRLHTVIPLKEPFGNFLSWLKMAEIAPPKLVAPLGTEELLANFILSFQTLTNIHEDSQRLGLQTTVFDYESLKTQPNDVVTRDFLTRLDIDPNAYTQSSWTSQESVSSNESGIVHVFPRVATKLHDELDASSGFQYFAPPDGLLPAEMHDSIRAQLDQSGVYEAYYGMLEGGSKVNWPGN